MSVEVLNTFPNEEDYILLEEHQSETPGTFFGGKQVLHCKVSGVALSVPRDQLQSHDQFAKLHIERTETADGPAAEAEPALIANVDIWVGSERLIICQTQPTPTGISIPYQNVALHGVTNSDSPHGTGKVLTIQLSLEDTDFINDEDEYQEHLPLTVFPPDYKIATSAHPCIEEMSKAIHNCSCLNEDPDMSDEEGEEEEDDIPGAGGWITSDNMDQYLDDQGNFIGGGRLGDGAGHVRVIDEVYGANGENGVDGEEADETKWRRTD